MSAPQQNTPKGSRRASRKQGQNSRSVVSDNDAYSTLTEHHNSQGEGKSRQRRKSHATKKPHIQGHSDAAVHSDGPTQRSTSHSMKTQATPVKQQAYAGPTFHQSPAASALPMPSFYSKSLPGASFVKPGTNATQSPGRPPMKTNNSDVPPLPSETHREATPLDFLFDAARKANITPGTESPNKARPSSSATETPVSQSPAIREGDSDFPFELDSGDQSAWDNGTAYSTPYKERIEALRSNRAASTGGRGLSEDERKAKSAALKNFLMNSASNQSGSAENNPFNARPAPTYSGQEHRQSQPHRSTPNTPYSIPGQKNQQQYFPQMPPLPPMPPMAQYQSPSRHGPTSNLRNVYQPMLENQRADPVGQPQEQPRISTARDQGPIRSNLADIYKSAGKPNDQVSGHRATPSAQQLEDDLRKFLKLDLISPG